MVNKKIKIRAFGLVAESIGCHEIEMERMADTNAQLNLMKSEYPKLRALNFSLAIDNEMIQDNTQLKNANEMALLPPFSGG